MAKEVPTKGKVDEPRSFRGRVVPSLEHRCIMPRAFSLTAKQRDELLHISRKDPDPERCFRAHIILLLAAGYARDTIEAILFRSGRAVDRWLKRSQAEGVEGLTGRQRSRPFRFGLGWVAVLASWVTTKTPATSASSAAAGPARSWPRCSATGRA